VISPAKAGVVKNNEKISANLFIVLDYLGSLFMNFILFCDKTSKRHITHT
jgi:hypothetical protein